MKRFAYTLFGKYVEAGFLDSLIPILPPDAEMSPDSAVDPSQRGKIPGEFNVGKQHWTGMPDWTTRVFTKDDVKKWNEWPNPNVGIKTKYIPTADLDVRSEKDVEEIAALFELHLGWAPRRGRAGSARIAMPYLLADGETPVPKIRIAFRQPGDDEVQAVELLGDGQQFVIEGTHPSGKPYEWEDYLSLTSCTRAGLTKITADDWRAVSTAVENYLVSRGYEIVRRSESGAGGADKPIGDPSTIAPDKDDALAALFARSNEGLSYEEFISTAHAFKAAVGGDEAYYPPFEQWALQYPENTAEWVEGKWNSIEGSAIGWDWLRAKAREAGWTGGADTDFEAIEPTPDEKAADDKLHAKAERELAFGEEISKLPKIVVRPDGLRFALDEAERALVQSASIKVYVNSGRLVEMIEKPEKTRDGVFITMRAFESVGVHRVAEIFEGVARFEVPKQNNYEFGACPPELAKRYLDRKGQWKVPDAIGLTSMPILRPDGSIHTTAGFDPKSRLIYAPGDLVLPAMPETPTRDDARQALDIILNELLPKFPFMTDAHRSVALSIFLTPFVLNFVSHAPLHLVSAPVAGSGKGLIVDTASVLHFGHPAPAVQHTGEDAEFEKRLDSMLIAGIRSIAIDNVEHPIGGAAMCTMLTQSKKQVRILGRSKMVTANCEGIFIAANGNNLRIRGDMRRRAVLCYIDPKCSDPHKREFDFSPVDRAMANRGRYIAALLTVLRAYMLAGQPITVKSLNSFERWSQLIGGCLVWLGLPSPVETSDEVFATDPEGEEIATVMRAIGIAIYGVVKDNTFTAPALAAEAGDLEDPSLRNALLIIAQKQKAGFPYIDAHTLGCWLAKQKNKFAGGYRVVEAGTAHGGAAKWVVEREEKKA